MQCHDFVAEYDWEKYRRGWWNGGPFPTTLDDVLKFVKGSDKIREKCIKSPKPITFIQCLCSNERHLMYFYTSYFVEPPLIPKSWQLVKMNSHPDFLLHWFKIDNNFQDMYQEYYKYLSMSMSLQSAYFSHGLLKLVLDYVLCKLNVHVTCYNLIF